MQPIKQLKNIQTAFQMVRGFALLIAGGAFLMTAAVFIYHSHELKSLNQRVYVLANGQVLEAFASSRDAQVEVEANSHINRFHQHFFELSPDEQLIANQINAALYLADQSAKRAYDNLKEKGFYNQLLAGNVSQEIEMDSIQISLEAHPYEFTYYGKQKIVRTTSEVIRVLITRGRLREVARSTHNPHGFLIERWETLLNEDIKVTKR